jgi:hypothetical protein
MVDSDASITSRGAASPFNAAALRRRGDVFRDQGVLSLQGRPFQLTCQLCACACTVEHQCLCVCVDVCVCVCV